MCKILFVSGSHNGASIGTDGTSTERLWNKYDFISETTQKHQQNLNQINHVCYSSTIVTHKHTHTQQAMNSYMCDMHFGWMVGEFYRTQSDTFVKYTLRWRSSRSMLLRHVSFIHQCRHTTIWNRGKNSQKVFNFRIGLWPCQVFWELAKHQNYRWLMLDAI